MVRALQITVHVPLFQLILPASVIFFNSKVIEVTMFDILPSRWTFDLIFLYGDKSTKESEEGMMDQIQDVGYDNQNSL
jgi:hypothetical protein